MIQFYSPDIEKNPSLSAEEAQHCVKVLRKKEGDTIYVTDGKGKRFECEITSVSRSEVKLHIVSESEIAKSWNYRLAIAVAPTKNADRMAWLMEKCVEIGVDKIIFIKCGRSERKVVNIERLRRNAVSAMNQSLKTRLPEIEDILPLENILTFEGLKYFGYCDNDEDKKEFVKDYKPGHDVLIAIGPEGDFTTEEVERLKKGGFKDVTFGDERLRTETAALYGVCAVHVINDMK